MDQDKQLISGNNTRYVEMFLVALVDLSKEPNDIGVQLIDILLAPE